MGNVTVPSNRAPVAIGGLGGSGTRVFSALLQHAGLYMGSDLNPSLDNLWFTVLFKRRRFVDQPATSAELDQATRLFVTAMTTGLKDALSPADMAAMEEIRNTIPPLGDWRVGAAAPAVQSLINSTAPANAGDQPWGWKEPNTHIFLDALDQRIKGFRYIHVVRDALDMAFSGNTWQAQHWHRTETDDQVPLPVKQLRFWTQANRNAIEYGARHMKNRFLVVSYDDLCADPRPQWQRLMQFLDRNHNVAFPADLIQPTSIGRRDTHDLSIFSRTDLKAAELLTDHVRTLTSMP